ncbi:MAG: hypothetical protein WBE72_23805 [Terracidiphilus sp.]
MKPNKPMVLLLMVLPACVLLRAKDKKQPSVPAAFNQAHTAYVEAVDGQQFDRDLDPEDREAIADVQDLLQAWRRYKLVTQREDADIVFVVRKGRAAGRDGGLGPESGGPIGGSGPNGGMGPNGEPGGNGGMGPNGGLGANGAPFPGQPRSSGPAIAPGMDNGASQDLFEVCQVNANGKLTRPLWVRTLEGGLNGPQVLLFRQFKDAVEKAYPSQLPDQLSKP